MAAFGKVLRTPAARTGRIFDTDNSVASVRGPGVCCAMTVNWIATCKRLGRLVKTSGELSDAFSLAIGQSAGELSAHDADTIIQNANLIPLSTQTLKNYTVPALAAALVVPTGFSLFAIWGTGDGHAMGAYVTTKQWDFFDPNEGLDSFSSAGAFSAHLNRHIPSMYRLLNEKAVVYHFGAL